MKFLGIIKKRIFYSFFRKHPKMLVLIDLENILLSVRDFGDISSMAFPRQKFDEIVGRLGKIAQIVASFVFGPTNTITRHGDYLRELGFIPVHCPLMVNIKERGPSTDKRDTVDPVLIETGRTMMSLLVGLTHLCIVSGDSDFTPLARDAQRRGLDVVVVAGSRLSLSKNLEEFACFHKGKKAVFFLKEEEEKQTA